jgi:hypothetical protein
MYAAEDVERLVMEGLHQERARHARESELQQEASRRSVNSSHVSCGRDARVHAEPPNKPCWGGEEEDSTHEHDKDSECPAETESNTEDEEVFERQACDDAANSQGSQPSSKDLASAEFAESGE